MIKKLPKNSYLYVNKYHIMDNASMYFLFRPHSVLKASIN